MGIFHRYKVNKYGTHIFTFPDKKKLYQLKEDHFEKLPNYKLEYIQENSNYIANLGVGKQTLLVANNKSISLNDQVNALIDLKKYDEAKKKLAEQKTTLTYIGVNVEETEKTQEHILVTMFDMFFYFDDEPMFKFSEESLERKRYYLNEYPYFRNFFFRKLENYSTAYKDTYENVIRYAIIQTGIQSVIQDLIFTDLQEAKTD